MGKLIFLLATLLSYHGEVNAQSRSDNKKILVVYFSHSGNTRILAEQIRQVTGADTLELRTVIPYPREYQALVDQAKQEINEGVKPELQYQPVDIKSYDTIFIGSPCWWATIAPPVVTFLSSYDFSGKTIIPFMTHEGSRFGHTITDIRKLCPEAILLQGLPVRGGDVKGAASEVEHWLRKIGIIK